MMLKLTLSRASGAIGGPTWINPEMVSQVIPSGTGCVIYFPDSETANIEESAEDVARMVEEAKGREDAKMDTDKETVQGAAEFYTQHRKMPSWSESNEGWVPRLIMAAPEMYKLLKELEWFEHHESYTDLRCPICRGYADQGHESDCRLDAALKAVEGETQ